MSAISGLFNLIGTGYSNYHDTQMTYKTNADNQKLQDSINATNIRNTDSTNRANLQIAQATNESNERITQQTNEFNAAQADLAYQRSTSQSKVAELIQAGLTPSQARQVVAGAGITGSATAASGTAIPAQGSTMQTAQANAIPFEKPGFRDLGPALGQIGAGVDAIYSQWSQSFSAADGGLIGALQGNDAFEMLSSHISELPPVATTSHYNFNKFLSNANDGFWKDFRESKEFQDMWKKPLGRRYFMNAMQSCYKDTITMDNEIELQQGQIRLQHLQETQQRLQSQFTQQEISNAIKIGTQLDKQITQQDTENQRLAILLGREKELAKYITDAEIGRLKIDLADQALQLRLLNDPTYCDLWFKSELSNMLWASSMQAYSAMLAEGKENFFKQYPEDAFSLTIFDLLDDLGFANTSLCKDLMENYLAGGTIGTYMASRYKNYPTGIYENMYQYGLKPLWTYQQNALFGAGRTQRVFDTTIKFGEKGVDFLGGFLKSK